MLRLSAWIIALCFALALGAPKVPNVNGVSERTAAASTGSVQEPSEQVLLTEDIVPANGDNSADIFDDMAIDNPNTEDTLVVDANSGGLSHVRVKQVTPGRGQARAKGKGKGKQPAAIRARAKGKAKGKGKTKSKAKSNSGDPEDPQDPDDPFVKHPNAQFCTKCNCVKLAGKSHASKGKKHGHVCRRPTLEEMQKKLEEIQNAGQVVAAGPDDSHPGASSSSSSSTPYALEFGSFKRQLLTDVLADALPRMKKGDGESYVSWCIRSKLHLQYPNFRAALIHLGRLDVDTFVEIPRGVDAAMYHQMVQEEEAETGRQLDVAWVSTQKKRRKLPFRLRRCPKTCDRCGERGHVITTCPLALAEKDTKLCVSEAYRKAGAAAKKKRSDMYTNSRQKVPKITHAV